MEIIKLNCKEKWPLAPPPHLYGHLAQVATPIMLQHSITSYIFKASFNREFGVWLFFVFLNGNEVSHLKHHLTYMDSCCKCDTPIPELHTKIEEPFMYSKIVGFLFFPILIPIPIPFPSFP